MNSTIAILSVRRHFKVNILEFHKGSHPNIEYLLCNKDNEFKRVALSLASATLDDLATIKAHDNI
jgi:hypothetical protein